MILSLFLFWIIAAFLSWLLNRLLLRFVKTLGMRPSREMHDRWSPTMKPSIGGISFYLIFLLTIMWLNYIYPSTDVQWHQQMIGWVTAATVAFFLGLADDAYDTIPLLKFGIQVLCGLIAVYSGTVIQIAHTPVVNEIITVLWIVSMMNSINMLDNMDGISGSVSLVVLMACFGAAFLSADNLIDYTFVIAAISGALCGFLFYNINPSTIFMGDTGSQFLGAIISILSVNLLWNFKSSEALVWWQQLAIPFSAFVIPLTDTATVFFHRILKGRSPFIGGKDHTSHHLVYCGLKERAVMLVIDALSLGGSVMAWILLQSADPSEKTPFIMVWICC